jgi:Fic family protein
MKISTKKLIEQLKKNKEYTQCLPLIKEEDMMNHHSSCDICGNCFSVNVLFKVSSSEELICHNCIDQILAKVLKIAD